MYEDIEKLGITRGSGDMLSKMSYKKRFPSLYSGTKPTLITSEVIELMTNSFIVSEKILGTTRAIRWREDPSLVLFICNMRIERDVVYENLPGSMILFEATYFNTCYRIPFDELVEIGNHIGVPVKENRSTHPTGIDADAIDLFLEQQANDMSSSYTTKGNGGFVILSEHNMDLSGKFDRFDGHSTLAWEAAQKPTTIIEAKTDRKRSGVIAIPEK